MDALKSFFITVGIISILLFIALLIIGTKIVSTMLLCIIGLIAVVSIIGFIVFYAGKISSKNQEN